MPRLTLGAWFFVICLFAGLAASVWALVETIA